jgi:hypothetical protein
MRSAAGGDLLGHLVPVATSRRGVDGLLGRFGSQMLGGAPGRTRTCGHRLRRPTLYPAELRGPGRAERSADRCHPQGFVCPLHEPGGGGRSNYLPKTRHCRLIIFREHKIGYSACRL